MRAARAILVLVVSTIALANASSAQEFPQFCKANAGTSLFLIDRTTSFDEVDVGDFVQGLQRIYDQTGAGGRLIVYELATDALATRPIFDACRPSCSDSVWDTLTCDLAAAKRANQSYIKNVVERFKNLLKSKKSSRESLLLEGITLLTEEYSPLKISRLYVFSDLLENSEVARPERLLDPTATDQLLEATRSRGLVPAVRDADVRVFGVGRWHDGVRRGLRLHERRALCSFWERWFSAGGAKKVMISERYLAD